MEGLCTSVVTEVVQPPGCIKISLRMFILYSPSLQVIDISSFFVGYRRICYGFRFIFLGMSVQIIIIIIIVFFTIIIIINH